MSNLNAQTAPTDGMVLYLPLDGDNLASIAPESIVTEGDLLGSKDNWDNANSALQFSGEGTYLSMQAAEIENLPVGASDRTISFWIKLDPTTGDGHFFSYGTNGGNAGAGKHVHMKISADSVIQYNFWNYDFKAPKSTDADFINIKDEQWHFITAMIESGQPKLYIDATSVPLTGPTGNGIDDIEEVNTDITGKKEFIIGANNVNLGNKGVVGEIDEFRMYNRLLSEDEISGLYAFEPTVTPSIEINAPSDFTFVRDENDESKITFSWTDNSDNETGFVIEEKTDTNTWTMLAEVNADVSSYIFTLENIRVTATFRVKAVVNDESRSNYSEELMVEGIEAPPVSAPSNLVYTLDENDNTLVSLNWIDNSDNETYFVIEEKKAQQAWTILDSTEANVNSFTFNVLDISVGLKYRVKAINTEVESEYSNTVELGETVSTEVNSPSALYYYRNTPSYTEATLYWTDNSDNETGFLVEQKIDGASWVETARVSENTIEHSISQLDPTASIEFRVRALLDEAYSASSNKVRLVGTESILEVYPEVPGIRNPKDTTVNNITFGMIQDQCPAEPEQGKATRISTFFDLKVRPSSGGDWLYSPTYETRPQIRDLRAQNDPAHNESGHDVYAYGWYGPNSKKPNQTLHSRHWNNFDADTEVVIRVSLKDGALSQTIKLDQLEIYPAPLAINQIDDKTVDITLPGAGEDKSTPFSRHFMVTFNRKDWEDPSRGELVYEHPLMVFVNPVKPAPASAPENEYKEFKSGRLLVIGSGIHLPNDHLRFFGEGANEIAEEVYIPGDAYVHGGFAMNNKNHPVHVWGRGIYSDELFFVHQEDDNWTERTPWATIPPAEGNPWEDQDMKGAWEASVFLKGDYANLQTFEGLSSISRRMGTVTVADGYAKVIDHKDVGYAGGLYQKPGSKTDYWGIYTHNDDDITYCHLDYEMNHSTTRILHNGPSFQFGWGVNDLLQAKGRAYNHTTLPADKRGLGIGENHGVFNSRLQSGGLIRHLGGYYENFKITGQENIVFNIGISNNDDKINDTNPNLSPRSVFSDKVFKNFTLEKKTRSKNLLETKIREGYDWESYLRFIHFDNLVIEGDHIENINDGDHFTYENGVLLHTITFFSLPQRIAEPSLSDATQGTMTFKSEFIGKSIKADESLPVSLSPLCANSDDNSASSFILEKTSDGYVALKAPNGYYVKADPRRYGYVYTEPDEIREDLNTKVISEDAKFVWVDLGNNQFALYSKAMGLYVRAESNTGPNSPLYAASDKITEAETFTITSSVEAITSAEQELNPVSLFPNPATNILKIEGIDTPRSIVLYSLEGRMVLLNENTKEINVSKLTNGCYIIRVTAQDGAVSQGKVIVGN
ncbi:LamG-like jellyroll fold domain-containing protein [Sediminitomix flava]|nr:LamG-like jellyroll fold domain-containing protein [Sediminitomix flava]